MSDNPWIKEYENYFGELNLNLGSAKNIELSNNGRRWINLDMNEDTGCDVVHDLNEVPLPFAGELFDCVFGSHIFEHIYRERFLPLIADIHRILKPNGYLVAVTPYGTSYTAWENPLHHQLFTEHTWMYCIKKLYELPHAGYGATQNQPVREWAFEQINLVPFPEFRDDPELQIKRRLYNNVISDVHCVMKKL